MGAQLTTSERSAAMALGYTEQTWSTISQTRTSWSYFILSKAASTAIVLTQQQAAALLGYTQVSWDNLNQAQPNLSRKKWVELSATERSAAMVLGYTQQKSNGITKTKAKWSSFIVLTGTTIVMTRQQAAALLGYTQVSCDNVNGKQNHPKSTSKPWTGLTATQRAAAMVLGYAEQKWSKISHSKAKWSSLASTTSSSSSTNPGLIAAYVIIAIVGVLLLIGAILCIYYFVVMKRNQRKKEPKVIPDNGSAPKVVTVVPADEKK